MLPSFAHIQISALTGAAVGRMRENTDPAGIAQLVEQGFCKAQVASSSLAPGSARPYPPGI